jgi:hypothetical protein
MKQNRLLFLLLIIITPFFTQAQSNTTNALEKKYDAMALYFYNNTLRMLNQSGDKAFDELIKDIEKLKFLMIKKTDSFNLAEYKKVVGDYKAETFEEIMTSRFDGKNFDIFVKEADNKTKGMLVLVNDDESLYVLDIVGSLALNKVTELYKTIDSSSEIGRKIKAFAGDHDDDKEKKEKEENKD